MSGTDVVSSPPYPLGSRLEGKAAIVVGAGQLDGDTIGNGRATAIAFAAAGAAVLLVDRDAASAQETREFIVTEGGRAEILVADVLDETAAAGLGPACLDIFGRVDILDNNVGSGWGDASVTTLARETWERMLGVNVTTAFLCCKHVIPHLRRGGGGSVINMSSAAALAATPLAGYKVGKAALNALTQQLAMSNARHRVRVNAIMPGLLDTPMAIGGYAAMRGVPAEQVRAERNATVPLGRMGTAWDTAYAAVYLASDEASFVTGAILPVDGGQLLKVG